MADSIRLVRPVAADDRHLAKLMEEVWNALSVHIGEDFLVGVASDAKSGRGVGLEPGTGQLPVGGLNLRPQDARLTDEPKAKVVEIETPLTLEDSAEQEAMTLGEARDWLRDRVWAGAQCPCCTQKAKVYRRSIHATKAATLIKLYRAGGVREFIHTPDLPGDTHEVSQLSWWGLVEEELIRRPDGGRAGFWRVTELGARWVKEEVSVHRYAHVYDGRVLRRDGEPWSIRQALAKKFRYDELMAA